MSSGQSKLVVVADDDADTRALIAGHLRRNGCTVLEAADGDETVALARAHDPALLLVDFRMPGVDGLSAIRTLRAEAATRDVPVIVMTGNASALEALPAQLQEIGVISLLNKPFSLRDLTACVARGLNGTFRGEGGDSK